MTRRPSTAQDRAGNLHQSSQSCVDCIDIPGLKPIDTLRGYISIADVYNFFIGDDINTLNNPSASALQKTLAGADLALNLIPEGKGAGALLKVGIKELASHALTRMVERGITGEMAAKAVSSGAKYLDKDTGNVVHVLEGAGPGGQTVISITSQDGKKLLTVIGTTKKNYVAGKVNRGAWVPQQ